MTRSKVVLGFLLGAMLLSVQDVSATVITLGDQDFADGSLVPGVAAFLAPQAGEPAPIGTFIGSDYGPSGSTSFTFTFAPGAVLSASITLGLFDHDSMAPGSQVSQFLVDGVDRTAALDALLELHGGSQAEDDVYTLVLSGAALTALSDGSVTFSLALKGPGLQGNAGSTGDTTDFNGFGIDFARLEMNAEPVPEPGTCALVLAGLGLLRWRSRRS